MLPPTILSISRGFITYSISKLVNIRYEGKRDRSKVVKDIYLDFFGVDVLFTFKQLQEQELKSNTEYDFYFRGVRKTGTSCRYLLI